MIRQIRGTVLSVEPATIVVDVAGWGVEVNVAAANTFAQGKEVSLFTHMAVKQDAIELYGFADKDDLRFFELALSVSGVGPKTAMNLLRRAPRQNLEAAIGKRDVVYLTKVVGLGKKAAEKLVVEISEKLSGSGAVDDKDAEIMDTLVALGYTEREARKAVGAIPSDIAGKDARLKAALSASH